VPALFLEVAIRATLVAATTAVILSVLRIRTAAARHAAWTTVVVAMLLLPLWSLAGPKVPLAVLPTQAGSADADSGALSDANSVALAASLTQPGPTAIAEAERQVSESSRGVWLLIGSYLFGVSALLVRLAFGTVQAHRLRRQAVVYAGRATSAQCTTPITVGWLSPVVILPEGWERWSATYLDAVLTHEQEHARRRDPLIQWLALLNRSIFWFHPLAWWLQQRLAYLAEEACDGAVLRAGHSPQDYSEYLIDMARAINRQGRRLNVAGMAMPGCGLPNRMRHIFEELPMTPLSRTRVICSLGISTMSSILFAAATLAPRPSMVAHEPAAAATQVEASAPLATTPALASQARIATNARMLVARPQPASTRQVSGGPSSVRQANFAGDWVLVSTVSDGPGRGGGVGAGPGRLVSIASGAPVNCGLECTIEQNAQTLTIARTVETQGAVPPDIGTVVLNLDGRESTITQYNLAEYKATAGWEGDNLVVTRSIVDGALSVTQTMSREDDKLAVVVTFTGTTTAGDHLVAAPVTQTYVRR